jgi:hypothetical protein
MTHSALRTTLVAVLLVTVGCQGLSGSSNPPSDDRAVEAVMQAQEATGDITSYRFTVDGQVQISENSRTESTEITGDGVVDVEHRRVNETINRGVQGPGYRVARIGYVDGYTFDVECSRVGWARYNLTESTRWFNYTSLGQQLTLLDRTNIYWNGTETLDGVEMAVVTAHPTEQQLEANQKLPTKSGVTQGGAIFQNATIRIWIDTETNRVRKVQRELRIRGDGATAVSTVTYRFADYNDPTNITRPSFNRSGPKWAGGCPGT